MPATVTITRLVDADGAGLPSPAFTEPASRSTASRFSWLFRDVTPSLPLAGALSTRAFRALAARTIGGDAANLGFAAR